MDDHQPPGVLTDFAGLREASIETAAALLNNYQGLLSQIANRVLARERDPLNVSELVRVVLDESAQAIAICPASNPDELEAWLKNRLVNELLHRYRDLPAGSTRGAAPSTIAEDQSQAADAVDGNSRQPIQERLVESIAELPVDCQRVLILRHREGASFDEIEKALGRTSEEVRVLWNKAIELLSDKVPPGRVSKSGASVVHSHLSNWLNNSLAAGDTQHHSWEADAMWSVGDSISLEHLLGCYKCLEWLERVWPTTHSDKYPRTLFDAGCVLCARYKIINEIGRGAFGIVFRAVDLQLKRDVAMKVAMLKSTVSRGTDKQLKMALLEAQLVAGLQHPGIVQVFDVGRAESGELFVVSELIEGQNLEQLIRSGPLEMGQAVEITAKIADALAYAHSQGIVHRDVKPANILVDSNGEPHLADFGLAMTADKISGRAGTPAYMSPEQVNCREHRVDNRSDIYGLGVTFYEMLTGKPAFESKDMSVLTDWISTANYRPVVSCLDKFPLELQRIQEIAMAVRQSDRYALASEFADDLRDYNSSQLKRREPEDDGIELPIVPRGLRSFTELDADFFRQMLPGARDRAGLPRSVRFWKLRIEQDSPFEVGVLFGPSGCGKSSFVKAGLFPTLDEKIQPIYVEASPDKTVQGIMELIRQQVDLPVEIDSLPKAITFLCQTEPLGQEERFLIVIDQFEQWLQAEGHVGKSELVSALGNCDGRNVCAMLLVRDDYWMEVNRVMAELDIQVSEGVNSKGLDLFATAHAEKVLRMFGQANGDLPATSELSVEQVQFLEYAVSELESNGRVVCVHLALFSQMMKGRVWSIATLDELGGRFGVGVQFLEQSFGSGGAAGNFHRFQDKACVVLGALLPERSSGIKGERRSIEQLREASRMSLAEMEELIVVLDQKLRLISPVACEGNTADVELWATRDENSFYQLTHDFLVPSLVEWLHQKKQETRSGRAEICLADRAAIWESEPKNRHLPSMLETIAIKRFARSQVGTGPQASMIRSATRYYSARAMLAILALVGVAFGFWVMRFQQAEYRFEQAARSKVENLLSAGAFDIPRLLDEMDTFRPSANAQMKAEFEESDNSRRKIHAALGLAGTELAEPEFLTEKLLESGPDYVRLIRSRLEGSQGPLNRELWSILESPVAGDRVLPVACALALWDPGNQKWNDVGFRVADALVRENPMQVAPWMAMLKGKAGLLNQSLAKIHYREIDGYSPSELKVLTGILQDFAADDLPLLFELLLRSETENFLSFYKVFERDRSNASKLVRGQLSSFSSEAMVGPMEIRRRVNACLCAMKLGLHDAMWKYWDNSSDPSVRTEIVHSLERVQVRPGPLIDRLLEEPNPKIRMVLLQALGESTRLMSGAQREQLSELAVDWFHRDPDPGVHAACRWLVTQCLNDEALVVKIAASEKQLSTGKQEGGRHWYLTRTGGHTLTVIEGPVEFMMGSTPETDPDRDEDELRRRRRIGHSFAIGQFEVTGSQFADFWSEHPALKKFYGYTEEFHSKGRSTIAMGRVNWFLAAEYCNWLSEKEGIPKDQWCFPDTIDRTREIVIDDDYFEKTGYRLLSDAEWEMACRDGTLTNRNFGSNQQRLSEYGWWFQNSGNLMHPVGQLKPNTFGLFDIYGNALEWVFDGQPADLESFDDMFSQDHRVVNVKATRILRGGTYDHSYNYARSSYRNGYTADAAGVGVGVRLGRTMKDFDSASSSK